MSLEPKGWLYSDSAHENGAPLYALTPEQVAMLEGAKDEAQLSALVQSLDKRCAELEAENDQLRAQQAAEPAPAAQPEAETRMAIPLGWTIRPTGDGNYAVQHSAYGGAIAFKQDGPNIASEILWFLARDILDAPAEAQGERDALSDERILGLWHWEAENPFHSKHTAVISFARAILAANERKQP